MTLTVAQQRERRTLHDIVYKLLASSQGLHSQNKAVLKKHIGYEAFLVFSSVEVKDRHCQRQLPSDINK